MFKNCIAILTILFLFSCSQKKVENSLDSEAYIAPKYDTAAIDSFSTGAISVDVAAEIRRSSNVYQDSLRAAKVAAELAKKEQEAKQKMEKLDKEKKELENKKKVEKVEVQ